MTQFTVKVNQGSIDQKISRAEELFGEKVKDKLVSYASYGIEISPVDTGAFVESFSLLPRGAGGGRQRSSANRESLPPGAKQQAKQKAKAQVASDGEKFEKAFLKSSGAVIRNRATHASDVEAMYQVFGRMKDRFR